MLEFKLSKPEKGILLNLVDSVFYEGEINPFQVMSEHGEEITKVEVFRGNTYKNPLGWYEVTFKQPGPSFIKVFAKNSRGEIYVALTKSIRVMPLPQPKIFLCGVKADSAINIQHLIKQRKVEAEMPDPDLYNFKPAVLAFQFVLNQDTITVQGNEIPFEYKSKLYDLEEGNVFQMLNIAVMLPNGNKNIVVVPSFSVFLIHTDQYSVGSRKYISPAVDETLESEK